MPFSAFFPAGRADPTLIDRLTAPRQLQGLLRAAVGGLQSVMRRGAFALPPSVVSATANFKREADPLRGFIEERVRYQDDVFAWTPRPDLYVAYSAWSSLNGYHLASSQVFHEKFTAAVVELAPHPVTVTKRQGTYGYKGVSIK